MKLSLVNLVSPPMKYRLKLAPWTVEGNRLGRKHSVRGT